MAKRGAKSSTPASTSKKSILKSPASASTRATPRRSTKSPKSVSKKNNAAVEETTPPPQSRKRRKLLDHEENEEERNTEVRRVLATAQEPEIHDTPLSQDYFSAKRRSSAKKSVNKISDIHAVEEHELKAALAELAPKHEAEQAALLSSYKELYDEWLFQLKCGFGLLMYGFGSKRQLLENFGSTALTDGAVVVVNGYLPTANLKQVLRFLKNTLYKDSCGSSSTSKSLEETIGALLSYQGDSVVYLIIHSIDGPALRDNSSQQLLAKLAVCSHFRFVASLDNINGALLWNKRMANTQFSWWWHHTPTYAPYTVEAAYVPLILSSSGAKNAVRSAILVLQSLTPNAQSVFRLLADHQLANPEDEGLTQHQLYTKCRERFLVSSELTLRAHLTEFKDHKLVRLRKGTDGQDCLYITLPVDALRKLLEDLSHSN